jgi:hypothetical protein
VFAPHRAEFRSREMDHSGSGLDSPLHDNVLPLIVKPFSPVSMDPRRCQD